MPRRGIRKKIEKKYDNYEQMVVEKTINKLMWEGKKSVARNIFESAIAEVRERTGEDGLTMFRKAIEALKPELEVKSRRVGGANYQVPIPVRPDRKLSLAIRWLVNYARDRKDEYAMYKRLAKEIIDGNWLITGLSRFVGPGAGSELLPQVAEAVASVGVGTEDILQVTVFEETAQGGRPDAHVAPGPAHAHLLHIGGLFKPGYFV